MERPSWLGLVGLGVICASAVIVAALSLAGQAVPPGALALLGVLVIAAAGLGVYDAASGVFARPILGVRPELAAGRYALTFDDGPDPEHTRRILDLLDARGQRGTFFVIGARAAAHPELVAEIA